MKKLFGIICLVSTVSLHSALAQMPVANNTYLDAVYLSKLSKNFSIATAYSDKIKIQADFLRVLAKYNPQYKNCINYDSCAGLNPFLVNDNISHHVELMVGSSPYSGRHTKTMTAQPVLETVLPGQTATANTASWQAALINGTANFMAKRAKAEALKVALDGFFKYVVTSDDSEKLRGLFPKTFVYICQLKSAQNYYTTDLTYLRSLIISDFDDLPDNLLNNNAEILNLHGTDEDMLRLALGIYTNVKANAAIPEIIENVSLANYNDSNLKKGLQLLNVFNEALLNDATGKNMWVNPLDLNPSKIEFDNTVRYFYALLYEQIKASSFADVMFCHGCGATIDTLDQFKNKAFNLIQIVLRLNNTYNSIRNSNFNFKTPDDLASYIDNLTKNITCFLNSDDVRTKIGVDKSTIDNTAAYINIATLVIKKDYQKAIINTIQQFGKSNIKLNERVSRAFIFISELSTVNNQDDMENLLSSYSLPIGSASIKRNSTLNISVNSYVGIAGGLETAYGTHVKQQRPNIGLTAPIGIAVTFDRGHLTAFVDFVDLASIVNARLNSDTTYYSNLKIDQFFSPGLGLFYNIHSLPITLGFNFTYVPDLRTIRYENNAATITETNTSVTRFNFSVLIDIPFFTLYNKPITQAKFKAH